MKIPLKISFATVGLLWPDLIVTTLRCKQIVWHFAHDQSNCIFFTQNYCIWSKFHWILFLMVQLAMRIRKWLGTKQWTSRYISQWWSSSLTSKHSQMPLSFGVLYCDITCNDGMIEAKYKSDFGITTDTPYLALTGGLWGVRRILQKK